MNHGSRTRVVLLTSICMVVYKSALSNMSHGISSSWDLTCFMREYSPFNFFNWRNKAQTVFWVANCVCFWKCYYGTVNGQWSRWRAHNLTSFYHFYHRSTWNGLTQALWTPTGVCVGNYVACVSTTVVRTPGASPQQCVVALARHTATSLLPAWAVYYAYFFWRANYIYAVLSAI